MPGNIVDLTDLAQMRAVVHPARIRVLEELYTGAELTATQASALTGLTPSAMSYHLAQLAKLGLIERADATRDGRQRPWRVKGAGFRMSAQPDEYVGAVMNRYVLAAVAKVVATSPPAPGEDRPWPASYSMVRTRLTKDQMKELDRRINEVLDEFDALESPDGIEYDMFWIHGVRVDDAAEEPAAADTASDARPHRARRAARQDTA